VSERAIELPVTEFWAMAMMTACDGLWEKHYVGLSEHEELTLN